MFAQANVRKASQAQLLELNPVIASGDVVIEKETGKFKIGDGVKTWSRLLYKGIDSIPEIVIPNEIPQYFANPTGTVDGLTSVLPLITDGNGHYANAGLVTVAAGAELNNGDEWYVVDPSTPLTFSDAYSTAAPLGAAHAVATQPTVGLAVYANNYHGKTPPTALPEGWAPGNTTGSGPIAPYLGPDGFGNDLYACLVYVEAGSNDSYQDGFLAFASLAPSVEGVAAWLDGDVRVTTPVIPGVYLAVFNPTAPAKPRPMPAGWSFVPYGLGAASPVLKALGDAAKSFAPEMAYVSVMTASPGSGKYYINGMKAGAPTPSWLTEDASGWKVEEGTYAVSISSSVTVASGTANVDAWLGSAPFSDWAFPESTSRGLVTGDVVTRASVVTVPAGGQTFFIRLGGSGFTVNYAEGHVVKLA